MATMSEELFDILENEKKQYEILRQYAYDKKNYLIENDMKKLEDITNRERVISTVLNRLEKRRIGVVNNLSEVLNDNNLSIAKLAEKLPNSDKDRLLKLKEALLEIIIDLKKQNEFNSLLIEEGLNVTEYTLNVMKGPDENSNSYSGQIGYGNINGQRGYFDTKR